MKQVDIYGQDHSPWVQAVLLGLYEKGTPYTLTTLPPLSLFGRSGIMMPAARFDDESWRLRSNEILRQLDYEAISSQDMLALYGAWLGVAHRVDHPTRFWKAFSFVRDPHPSRLLRLRNHFFRSFAVLYFFLLINLMVRTGGQPDPENFADQFLHWERMLAEMTGEYLCGKEPGILDMMLFGIIQCHCSIPVPPIQALQNSPELSRMRGWIGAMQQRFAGYAHLYSGVYFEPYSAAPVRASRLERMFFWLGSTFMLVGFPITIPLVLFYARRIGKAGLRGPGPEPSSRSRATT